MDLDLLRAALDHAPLERVRGRLLQAVGPLLEAEMPGASVGALCSVGESCLCEVVGFRERRALLMPLGDTTGVRFGADVWWRAEAVTVPVGEELLGRVVDGLGQAMDGGPPIACRERRQVRATSPDPLKRSLIVDPIRTGVRAIDGLLTIGRGQRIGVMAGSGVGKSTLMGMLARHVEADVNVICLVGERGREVREFIEHSLGKEGLRRSVVVVVTAEQSAALRVKAAFLATTIAEWFRDRGQDVLLMVDSLTRMGLAQREIGLASGEPPTTRGYTPSVFTLLPRLLERAGPGDNGGSITGIYNVLIEGDDIHDPIGDAVRGIVDGHIMLSRKLASHGHYPAIDILGSLSRLMTQVVSDDHLALAMQLRDLMATWDENEELVRLGAYRKGSAPEVDRAIDKEPLVRAFLRQGTAEDAGWESTIVGMAQVVS